jgi:membrane-bound ClpP family serine protease
MSENAIILAFVLLAISVFLFAAEFFIPSGGLITVLAISSLVASILFAGQAWWSDSQGYFWSFVAAAFVLVPLSILAAIQILPHTAWGRHLTLEPPEGDVPTGYHEQMDFLESQVGRTGITVTVLNPGGMVEVDGERLHCEGEGMMLESGEVVEVTGVRGNRLRVRPTERPLESADSDPDDAPLDLAEFEG